MIARLFKNRFVLAPAAVLVVLLGWAGYGALSARGFAPSSTQPLAISPPATRSEPGAPGAPRRGVARPGRDPLPSG